MPKHIIIIINSLILLKKQIVIFTNITKINKFLIQNIGVVFIAPFWSFWCLKNPRALRLCKVSHQTSFFNEFLPDFREIRPEKSTRKTFKMSH